MNTDDGLTTRIEPTRCLWCGKLTTAISHLREAVTFNPGDVIQCMYCKGRTIIGDDGKMRAPRKGELEHLFFEQPELAREVEQQTRVIEAMHKVFPGKKRKMKR